MKVLITGAAGDLGQKLRRHLQSSGRYDLTLLDRRAEDTPCVITADLSTYDESWVRCFHAQDVIVHLAAERRPRAPWESLQNDNVDALLNVFRAAVEKSVKRVVFASTGRAFPGYAYRRLVRHDFTPKPIDYYGATKIFGERLGRSYADQFGLSVICLRIGLVCSGDRSPEEYSYDSQRHWLSSRDFCQAAEKALEVPDVRFAALFVTSANEDPMWDLSETRRVLGYEPRDRLVPVKPSPPQRFSRALIRRLWRWSHNLPRRIRNQVVSRTGVHHDNDRANQRTTL